MRQVILDTETTGLDPSDGHRVIEIGCIEMVNRRLTDRTFHAYINPEREIEPEAIEVHGITNEFLRDKANFAGVAEEFIEFISGAELIAHNASFDLNFLEAELQRIPDSPSIFDLIHGGVAIDTLAMAREKDQESGIRWTPCAEITRLTRRNGPFMGHFSTQNY